MRNLLRKWDNPLRMSEQAGCLGSRKPRQTSDGPGAFWAANCQGYFSGSGLSFVRSNGDQTNLLFADSDLEFIAGMQVK